MFILMLIYNIANSGCLLYPVQITCPDNLIWGYGKEKVIDFKKRLSIFGRSNWDMKKIGYTIMRN